MRTFRFTVKAIMLLTYSLAPGPVVIAHNPMQSIQSLGLLQNTGTVVKTQTETIRNDILNKKAELLQR